MLADPELPAVYRMSTCGMDSAFSFSLGYRGGSQQVGGNPTNTMLLQVAFQYNTLIEATESDLVALGKEDQEFYLLAMSELGSGGKEPGVGYNSFPKNLLHPENEHLDAHMSSGSGKCYAACIRDSLDLTVDWERRLSLRAGKDQAASNSQSNKHTSNRTPREAPRDRQLDGEWRSDPRRCYDKKKRLMAVRRLRVITFTVECSNKRLRLIRSVTQKCHNLTRNCNPKKKEKF